MINALSVILQKKSYTTFSLNVPMRNDYLLGKDLPHGGLSLVRKIQDSVTL